MNQTQQKALNSNRQTWSLRAPEKGIVNIPPSRQPSKGRQQEWETQNFTAHYHKKRINRDQV